MADIKITDLPIANSIDAVQDTFPIVNHALDETQQINRNVFLGITGNPVGTSDSQSIGNKTIGVSNTVTLLDTLFTLADNSDPTKQAQFQLSGITTSTTRIYTLPNASSTLADIATAQTFTNKTLTSPIITGGSITNSTISVDNISEYTSANGVTIDGLNIKDAKLNTSNSVVSSNITDSAVTPAKLLTGTGSSWVWQSWTPTWANLTVGNGTVAASYTQIGKTVIARTKVIFGSTSSMGTSPTFTLPVTANSSYSTVNYIIGNVFIEDAGVAGYNGQVELRGSTTVGAMEVFGAASTYVNTAGITASIPMSWGIADNFSFYIVYEAA